MPSRQIKVSKYYRLATKHICETNNVSVVVDSLNRSLIVHCEDEEKENITINMDKSKYPRIFYRDPHVYCMFSTSSSNGFRLSFDDQEEKEKFLKEMHSIGYLTENQTTDSPNRLSQKSLPSSSSSRIVKTGVERVYSSSQGKEIGTSRDIISYRPSSQQDRPQQPRLSLRPTPSPHSQRDSSSARISRRPIDSFSPGSSSQKSSSSRSSSQGSVRSSSRRRQHDYGESVPAKRVKSSCEKFEKSTQTDDLLDVLIEDEEFTKKVLNQLMNNDGFIELVGSLNEQLANMDEEERKKLYEMTDPDSKSNETPTLRPSKSENEWIL
uniref:WH1 domain-containing protein n=1 Tax=Caenorhabditis tropicalis TaxID=1561998 RepID=A0A1I7TU76_9PELO